MAFHSSNSFQYSALGSSLPEFRVFEILPDRDFEDISGTLVHVYLDSYYEFEALSYTWGDEQPTHTIKVDGKLFAVCRNLYDAMKELRGDEKPRIIWVDAICINQDDIAELSAQVSIMRRIFEKAEQVLVWLGHEEVDSLCNMRYLGRLLFDRMADSEWATGAVGFSRDFSIVVESPWWRRVWTVQEIAVARNVLVMCGKETMTFRKLIKTLSTVSLILKVLGPSYPQAIYIVPAFGFVIGLFKYRAEFQQKRNDISLMEILQRFRSSLAMDPRDKVFGFLKLATGGGSEDFRIDYSLPASVVYMKLAQHIITTTNSLNILAFAPSAQRAASLPSWVPDWSQQGPGHTPLRTPWNLDRSSRPYSVSGNLKPSISFSPDLTVLSIDVLLAGDVGVCPPGWRPGIKRDAMRAFESLILHTYGDASPRAYGGEGKAKEAFRRTFILDVIDGSRIDAETFARFNKYFERDGPEPDPEEMHSEADIKLEAVSVDGELDFGLDFDFEALRELHPAPAVDNENPEEKKFRKLMWTSDSGRKPFISPFGFIGLGPLDMMDTDIVCVALGAEVPWIVRRLEGRNADYRFIGECYVHGFMDGKIIRLKFENQFLTPQCINLH